MSGFHETQEQLENVSTKKSELDEQKGKTLEDISELVGRGWMVSYVQLLHTQGRGLKNTNSQVFHQMGRGSMAEFLANATSVNNLGQVLVLLFFIY